MKKQFFDNYMVSSCLGKYDEKELFSNELWRISEPVPLFLLLSVTPRV